jgi:hypothetical protein
VKAGNFYRSRIEQWCSAAAEFDGIPQDWPQRRFGTEVAQHEGQSMVNIWFIAAGALVALATALALRRGRRNGMQSSTAVGAVSEEWLSQARGQTDQGW